MRRALLIAALLLAAAAAPALAVPSITYFCTPAPASCDGWYREPVTVHWVWDPPSAIPENCDIDIPVDTDTPGTVRSCRVRIAPNAWISAEVSLRVDMTPPLVTGATPSRPPDAGGWYRSPLQVAFSGTDATSGVLGCTTAGYGGPDGPATVAGTCTDNAGNVSEPGVFELRYDATAPAITDTGAVAGDHSVWLHWKVSGAIAVEVWRSPGRSGAAQSLLDTRADGSVSDRGLRNGRRYQYRVVAVDEAGNAASRVVSAVPGRRLLGPAAGAQLAAPPLLRWTAVRGARYYNVQLFRNGRKVLSAWPTRPRFQLRPSWRYGGERHRLRAGRYRWLVWPGRGPRAKADYGPKIGPRSFTYAP